MTSYFVIIEIIVNKQAFFQKYSSFMKIIDDELCFWMNIMRLYIKVKRNTQSTTG